MTLLFHCANCQEEWREPFCCTCGANLTPPRPAGLRMTGEQQMAQWEQHETQRELKW